MLERVFRSPHFFLILLCNVFALHAFAVVGSGISYQGRILKPDGTVESDSAVQFKIQVRTPGTTNCLMYEETQTFDMSSSEGSFALTVNGSSSSRTDASGYSLDSVFSNSSNFTFAAPTCTGANTYTPALSDGRVLSVSFKDSGMSSWEAMPSQALNYVPMALQAKAVAGFDATSLVRVQESNGTLDVVSPLNNAQYNELLALIGGTSAQYQKAGELNGTAVPSMTSGQVLGWNGTVWTSFDPLASLPAFAKTSLPVCGANTFLKDDGAGNLTCVAVAGASGGTVTSITAGTGLSGGAITSVGTISVAAGGITNTELASNAVHSGNIQDGSVTTAKLDPAVNIVTSGSIATSGNISAANVSATGLSGQTLNIFETTNHFAVTIQASASLGANYSLTLPLAAGTNGQVLSTSGGGALTWTTVTGVTPGGAAGGDLSGTYPNPQVAKLQGSNVSTITPGASSVLRFVSGAWTPSFVNFADVKSSGGLQQFPATCTAGQTLTYASGTDTFVCTNISVDASAIATGILPVANGGTGSSNGSIAGSGALTFAAGGSNQNVAIQPSGNGFTILSGNVGIGTNAPNYLLQLNSSGSGRADLQLTHNSSGTTANDGLTITQNGTASYFSNNENGNIFIGSGNGVITKFFDGGATTANYFRVTAAAAGSPPVLSADGSDTDINIKFIPKGTGNTLFTSGNIGVGVLTPSAVVQIKAGAAAAGKAPLKFTSGPVLTTAEAGAVEFDGTNLYYTDSSNARQTLATTSGTSSFSGVTTISNAAGDITLAPKASTNGVAINSATASTSSTTGALKVSGGEGVSGDIFAGASINAGTTLTAGTSLITPQIYGVSPATGNIKIDGTSNATKGYVLLNSAGGNVGIGSSAPAHKLDIYGTPVTDGALQAIASVSSDAAYSTAPTSGIGFAANWNSGGANAILAAIGGGKSNTTDGDYAGFLAFYTRANSGSNTEQMRISPAGNVGIGTSAPAVPLDVQAVNPSIRIKAKGAGANATLAIDSSPGQAPYISFNKGGVEGWQVGPNTGGVGASNTMNFWDSANSVSRMSITTSGFVGLGTTTPVDVLDIRGGGIQVGPYYSVSPEGAGTAVNALSANYIRYNVGATSNVMWMASSGNVGLSTATPAYKLDVVGDIHATGKIFNGAGGSSLGSYSQTVAATWNSYITTGLGNGDQEIFSVRVTGTNAEWNGVFTVQGTNSYTPVESYSTAKLISWQGYNANVDDVQAMIMSNTNSAGFGTSQFVIRTHSTNAIVGPASVTVTATGANSAAMVLTDNGATTPATFVGASSANTYQIYQSSTGFLGIGSASPAYRVDIAGTLPANNGILRIAADNQWQPCGVNCDGGQLLLTGATNQNMRLAVGVDTVNKYGYLRATESGVAVRNLVLQPDGANVGINTTSPSKTLDVNGDVRINGSFWRPDGLGLEASFGNGTNYLWGTGHHFMNGAGNAEWMTINGNVGIGTASPTQLVEVRKDQSGDTRIKVTNQDATAGGMDQLTVQLSGGSSGTENGYISLFPSTYISTSGMNRNDNMTLQTDRKHLTIATAYQSGGGGGQIHFFTGNGGQDAMDILANGSVGIGTTNPLTPLEVAGTVFSNTAQANTWGTWNFSGSALLWGIRTGVAGDIAFDTWNSGAQSSPLNISQTGIVSFNGPGGSCAINGSGSCTSDQRLKSNIESISGKDALAGLAKITGVTYNWTDPSWEQKQQVGVIAQSVQKAFPQLVSTMETKFQGVTGTYYTVNYAGLTAPLISAVNELNRQVASLKEENGELKARLERLEKRLNSQ